MERGSLRAARPAPGPSLHPGGGEHARLGIGLNAAAFSVVDAVLFRPLPVDRPERLVRVFSATPEDPVSHSPLTWPEVVELRRGASTLVLAAVGTYGLMAHAAAERRHEIGVRLAIGAGRGEVERLLVREGMALALAGVGCGLLLAALLGRFLEPILFGVGSTDAIAFGAAAAVLLAAAAAASYLPAHRVARIEPVVALRHE